MECRRWPRPTDGWFARSLQKRGEPIDLDNWTLYHLETDFSEAVDVAERHPERLASLKAAFDAAAWQHLAYPLDNRDRRGPVHWDLYERHGAFPFTGETVDVVITPGRRAER